MMCIGLSDIQACPLTDEVFDERISNALSFIQKLQMEFTNDFVRCPYLAIIEIEKRRRMKGRADDGKFVEHKVDRRKCIVRNTKRKSLVPRLIYLSIQSAPSSSSSSLKEILEANGSVADSERRHEFKHLLERYAGNIGLPFDDAKNMIVGIVVGQRSFADLGRDVVEWMNFAIFVNGWNLYSHHPILLNGDGCNLSSWQIVDILVKTCITEQLMCAQPILTSPGGNLPVLVQLVAESFSWHILIIQSCMRSMLPHGKRKNKSAADQLNLPQVQAVRGLIECLISAIQGVNKWLGHQINRPEDEKLDILLSHVNRKEFENVPGRVFQALEDYGSANNSELGERISRALQSWSSTDVVRRFVGAQRSLLSRFQNVCDTKLKLLETLKQSI